MSDFPVSHEKTTRSVVASEKEAQPIRSVTLECICAAEAGALWQALTRADSLRRWFLPVAGELEIGGRYQLEGNAGGTITECDSPHFFSATWEFGADLSWIEVSVAPLEGGRSRLTLSHLCPVNEHWHQYGPGAAGVGWDLALLSLAAYLAEPDARFDGETFATTAAGKTYIHHASEDWGRAAIAAGDDAQKARTAARLTAAFYTGEETPEI